MAAMQWCRLWHDAPTDPKWRTVARRSGRSVADVLGVWMFMLTNASASPTRGTLHAWDDEDVAVTLEIPVEAVAAIREAMQGRALDGDTLTGWHARNPKREDASTVRVRAFRERNKAQGNAAERDVTHGNAREEKRREEEKREQQQPLLAPAAADAAPASSVPTLVAPVPASAGVAASRGERPGRPKVDRPAKPETAKYPHYSREACDALYAVWTERRGPYDYPRFRRDTAGLFPSDPPPYPLAELTGALKLALAVLKHRSKTGQNRVEWNVLTPSVWASRIVEWVEDYRRTQADPDYTDTLFGTPAGRASA
jgi:hypothetical protein